MPMSIFQLHCAAGSLTLTLPPWCCAAVLLLCLTRVTQAKLQAIKGHGSNHQQL